MHRAAGQHGAGRCKVDGESSLNIVVRQHKVEQNKAAYPSRGPSLGWHTAGTATHGSAQKPPARRSQGHGLQLLESATQDQAACTHRSCALSILVTCTSQRCENVQSQVQSVDVAVPGHPSTAGTSCRCTCAAAKKARSKCATVHIETCLHAAVL